MCIRDRPYSYQQEILDRLDAERTVRGYNRNLVVDATGTGKTVISALDYKLSLIHICTKVLTEKVGCLQSFFGKDNAEHGNAIVLS